MWRLRAGGRRFLTHSGGLGSPSGPTTGVCHSCWLDVALVNGGKPSGSADCGGLRRCPEERSRGQKSPRWSVERRFRSLCCPAIRTLRCGTVPKSRLSALHLPHFRGRPPGRPRTRTGAGKDGARSSLTCITVINNVITGGHMLLGHKHPGHMHPRLTSTNSTLRQQTLAAFRLLSPLPCDAVACMRDSASRDIRRGAERADNKKNGLRSEAGATALPPPWSAPAVEEMK
jgi:hypothetical protein